MHTDEAVHAYKFGMLLEKNVYRYDSKEYHGPTLNYFTLIPAWISSVSSYPDLNEKILRIVPVFFGLLLIGLTFLLIRGLGWYAVLAASFLTAISPSITFYSRYYVQEILLICFLFGFLVSGYRYLKMPGYAWAVFSGIFLGLMHATKETFVIYLGAMLLALVLVGVVTNDPGLRFIFNRNKFQIKYLLIAFISAAVISILFFSSFFSYPQGVLKSFSFIQTYFQRAGQNKIHIHPWYYYLRMLAYWKVGDGPIWSELIILLLAFIGIFSFFLKSSLKKVEHKLHLFLIFYAILTATIFSAIPYKTPWNMLGFLHAFILLAGIGVSFLLQFVKRRNLKIVLIIILSAGFLHLGIQNVRANGRYCASPLNPYVYAHPTTRIYDLVDRVNKVVESQPEGKHLYMEVIFPESNYWPLPWYLRKYPNVGYWAKVNMEAAPAPLILAAPQEEALLLKKLYEFPPPGKKNLYVPLFDSKMEIRPGAEIKGFVTLKVWNNFQNR